MNTKSILQSKTFWLGVVTAFAPLIPGADAWIGSHVELVGSIWGAVAIALRFITKDAVALTP